MNHGRGATVTGWKDLLGLTRVGGIFRIATLPLLMKEGCKQYKTYLWVILHNLRVQYAIVSLCAGCDVKCEL